MLAKVKVSNTFSAKATLFAFGEELEAYPLSVIREACRQWSENNIFWPSWKELRDLLEDLVQSSTEPEAIALKELALIEEAQRCRLPDELLAVLPVKDFERVKFLSFQSDPPVIRGPRQDMSYVRAFYRQTIEAALGPNLRWG